MRRSYGSTAAPPVPGDYVYFGGPLNLQNRQTNGAAFDTSLFDTRAADQFQYRIRTFSTTYGDLRQDGINNFDTSLLKRFAITETAYLQLRFEPSTCSTIRLPPLPIPRRPIRALG